MYQKGVLNKYEIKKTDNHLLKFRTAYFQQMGRFITA